MSQTINTEELNKLALKTSIKTMYTFTITADRHIDRYKFRTKNFPDSYSIDESP